MIAQYCTLKSKLLKYSLKKSSTLQYHKPPCLPHRPNPGMSQMLLLIKLDCFLAFFIALQRAKKVVSDSTGLVDFAMWPVNSVLDLTDGQVTFLGEFMNNFFRARWNDFWANTCQLQLAQMTSCKTDFLCTLHRLIIYFFVS